MKWELTSSEPITTESRRAVQCMEDETLFGVISIRWNEFRQPEFYGSVTTDDYVVRSKVLYENPSEGKVLDENPTIV